MPCCSVQWRLTSPLGRYTLGSLYTLGSSGFCCTHTKHKFCLMHWSHTSIIRVDTLIMLPLIVFCACSLKLKESKAKGGGLVVEGVSGNAAKSGIKPGDTIIYASSWFGDELWPTDKLSFTISAIQRAPSPVAFVYVSAELRRAS